MPSMWRSSHTGVNYQHLWNGVELQSTENGAGESESQYGFSSSQRNLTGAETDALSSKTTGDGSLSPCKRAKQDGAKSSAAFVCLSLFMILVVTALSLGLGGYSVFVFKPAPFIDKSVDAFSIPNHKASKEYHALQAAKSEQIQMLARRTGRSTNKGRLRHVDEEEIADAVNLGRIKRESAGETFYREHFLKPAKKDDSLFEAIHQIVKRSPGMANWDRYSYVCSLPQTCVQWKLQVIFKAIGDDDKDNIFTTERLQTVHNIEKKVTNNTDYRNFCWKDPAASTTYDSCAPLNSLMTYFFPSVSPTGQLRYDGRGLNIANINSSLDLAMSHKEFYYFVDENVNTTHRKSRLLRTEVLFGSPIAGYINSLDHKRQQAEKFKKFIISYIDLLSSASTSKVQVLYGGNEIFDYEVESTFWSDLRLAQFALIFIGLFVFVLTSFSLWLTVWGLISIALSFPLAIFFYRVAFNIQALGILNGAAAFVVIGIGVDDVFVFVNTFRQAEHMDRIKGRILYTVKTAGKATFFTSFTTAAAFAANIASTIPALHEFGLFMALIVACCWLSVVLLIPPVLYIWYFLFAWMENLFFKTAKKLFYKVVLRKDINTLQVYYRSGSDEILTDSSSLTPPSSNDGDDDDVPLLTLEDDDDQAPNDTDEPLLVPYVSSTDSTICSSRKPKGTQLFDLGHLLQQGLCRFVTRPVIKARWVVAVIYVVILMTSIGLITQIKSSSKPPQLFKEQSNLQQMLDLKANLSIDKFSCPRCSGLYANMPKNPIDSTHEEQTTPAQTTPMNIPFNPKPTKSSTTKGNKHVYQKYTPSPSNPSIASSTASSEKVKETTLKTTKMPEMTTSTIQTTTTSPMSTKTTYSPLHIWKSTTTVLPKSKTTAKINSVPKGFKVCQGKKCGKAEKRPVMEANAIVYVVFGIRELDRSHLTSDHVISDNYGKVVYDPKFPQHFNLNKTHPLSDDDIKELCVICKKIASNSELVVNGSAQCLPSMMDQIIGRYLHKFPECNNLPRDLRLYNQRAPGHAEARPTSDYKAIKWMAFAFESKTSKGQSYFTAYDEYLKWERFINEVKSELRKDSPLQSIYQTSEFWTKVLMEVVCVSSAIYGVVLSIIICVIAVAIFTGHLLLLLIVLMTIGGIISLVVALFYVAGWEMGAVEAVSLSILVGSSVDYCVHVVEGYLLAGESPQLQAIECPSKQRQWRVLHAVQHIGVSIVSSAVTTVAAAIPLTQTTIRPFSRFGDIVAMNTTFAIVYALTACSAFLALFGPARFKATWKSSGIALLVTLTCTGVGVLILFILSRAGVNIPSPNGDDLFPK